MEKEKRKIKGYKIRQSIYDKAMQNCAKGGSHLAVHLEWLVTVIAEGGEIKVKNTEGKTIKVKI